MSLTNADFRKLLETPALQQRPTSATAAAAGIDGQEKGEKKKQRKFYKPKSKQEEKPAGPVYRDRAAERRKEEGEDVEEAVVGVCLCVLFFSDFHVL
jgi:hypothetical protein